ncbi:PIN domain-like protein [Panus rudis PR-1116 ss-1]|nr:PIN domain-like protein [Panus rudis PR-1116 ss-1]
MGVIGLVPFLQKICPQIFKTHPNRLQGLRGKRLVLDGTLLTQRLHFAPMPNPYRHVLGWYRIIKELKDDNVSAVCIFDGAQRSLAKQLEIERRRRVRRLTASRGTFELERLRRLRKLDALLASWQDLDETTRRKAVNTVRKLLSSPTKDGSPTPLYIAGNVELPDDIEALLDQTRYTYVSTSPKDAYGNFDEADINELLVQKAGIPISSSQDVYADPFPHSTEAKLAVAPESSAEPSATTQELAPVPASGKAVEPQEPVPSEQPPSTTATQAPIDIAQAMSESPSDSVPPEELGWLYPTTPTDDIDLDATDEISSTLSNLYLDYRQSIPQLVTLAAASPSPRAPEATPMSEEESAEIKEAHSISKTQNQLTLDEGKFWAQLAAPTETLPSIPTVDSGENGIRAVINSLTDRSTTLSESYERRAHPPSTDTYEESKEIIRAMGISCIETDGPYEAEALASSVVVHGYADYVASEDTDVLVYEAPLLRNLANRNAPLVVISGASARSALDLTRSSFIDFILLLGTDFSQRIKNVGPHRALKFIREYGRIEQILENEKQYPPRIPPDAYLEQIEMAREVFDIEDLPPVPSDIEALFARKDGNEEDVLRVLKKYNLHWAAVHDWDYQAALAGNYFADNPAAIL